MPVVSFRHDRQQIILPMALLPPSLDQEPGRFVRLQALVDTGASASGIPIEVARQLGLPRRGKEIITTAGGTVAVRLFQFRIGLYADEGAELPYVLEREFIGIESHPGEAFQALIGMDVLGRSDLIIRRDGTGSLAFD